MRAYYKASDDSDNAITDGGVAPQCSFDKGGSAIPFFPKTLALPGWGWERMEWHSLPKHT